MTKFSYALAAPALLLSSTAFSQSNPPPMPGGVGSYEECDSTGCNVYMCVDSNQDGTMQAMECSFAYRYPKQREMNGD